ncbi:phosphatase PAP2 family protein [Hymenobacter arizonensis]|uniref:Undecaprenyl-diphosphatase n=1 Tax=Hymenobacter arizonensis TaxID=1227077 RepID=A0A1I6AI92_HYMAR|nr:phosphatase PAP2 family protein [Hymenobacter arizonensis]SFQ68409.1 undecaprenyl-diphosphatase [Hymenobacter arizonensis]
MMPELDRDILTGLNDIAIQSTAISEFYRFVADNNLLKAGLFMGGIWWLWFQRYPTQEIVIRNRQIIIGILVGCLVGMCIARSLTHLLPHRVRPLHNTELALKPPLETPPIIDDSTSFPSDHATLFCALAAGFFFISRGLGLMAMLYAIFFICFPRAFLGYHHASDLLAGALIGIATAVLANLPALRERLYRPVLAWQRRYPGVFYVGLFLMTYQINDLFNSTRSIMGYMSSLVK